MWSSLIEIVRTVIFVGAHYLGGSIGASIVVVSALIRLALLPLALRAAREARRHAAKLGVLKPELDRLQARHGKDPQRLFEETRALQASHGIGLVPKGTFSTQLVQLPFLGTLFGAVRSGLGARESFLWIADLGRGDFVAVLIAAGLTALAALLGPMAAGSPITPKVAALIGFTMTLLFVWPASAAIALSVTAGSAVSVLQSALVRREVARERLSSTSR